MSAAFRFVTGRPWLTLLLLASLTLAALSQIFDIARGEMVLEIDPSHDRLLPEDDPDKEFYDFTRKLFGNDETMLIALHVADVFTRENLETVRRLTERLEGVGGVHHVISLSRAVDIRGTADSIEVRPFVTETPSSPSELQEIREAVLGNPLYAGSLVSMDSRTTALVVYFLDFSDRDFINEGIDEEIGRIVAEEAGDAVAWITGGRHVKVAQVEYLMRDMKRNMPLVLLVLALVLAVSFRTLRGVVLPILTVVVALIWTMGFVAWLGRPLNLVTQLVPFLMLILGMSYAVHVVSEYYDSLREMPDADSAQAAERALSLVALPVALTALTTVAGFSALAFNPISAIAEFGQLAVAGVIASAVASLSVPPALVSVLGRPRRLGLRAEGHADGFFARAAGVLAGFALRHHYGIYSAASIIFVAALVATSFLEVGGDTIKAFPPDAPVRTDFDAVNRNLEGANPFNIVIETVEPAGPRTFQQPVNLRILEKFQTWLKSQPEIGGTTSIVDYLKLINRGFHENDPTYFAIPETSRLTSQLLFFGASDEIEGFVDAPRERANIVVRAKVFDRELVSAMVRRIEERMAEFPDHLRGRVTGNPILRNNLYDRIARGQAYSMVLALGLIYVILVVFFLSWGTGFTALIPNALVVIVFFGALGATGVSLNLATSVIGPMALGIAVDDTIHYFARFTADAKRFADEKRATFTSLLSVGRPITYTSLAICSGFLVLTGSDLTSQIQVGAMGAFTLAFAWAVDLTLTPALCTGLRVVTLWDLLILDLGEHPQRTIRMFEGLSKTMCRVVALMASLREIPSGERLMRIGDAGRELYLVVDGTLEVSIQGLDGRRLLNTCTRGDVIGEVGFFHESRSANVDVVEDARLLRLTQKNMQRLARRYPRTAARVFRNLGEVLAERLTTTTERLV